VKNSIAPLLLQLSLCHNCRSAANLRSNPIFAVCRSWTANQRFGHFIPMEVPIRKDISSISVLVRNGNGSYGTEEWQWYNGTSRQSNETATA